MFVLNLHSGLRYLVFLLAVITIVYLVYGSLSKTPYNKNSRTFVLVFTIILDLQVLIGIVLIFLKGFHSYMHAHIGFMALALITAHLFSILNKKKDTPGYMLAIGAVVIPTILILIGISMLP